MTDITQKSTERRQEYEVRRLRNTHARYRSLGTTLRSCFPNCDCTLGAPLGSCRRLLYDLGMLKEEWQRRQSSDGIHVQESRIAQDIWADDGIVDMLHHAQMDAPNRRHPDCGGISVLVGAGE